MHVMAILKDIQISVVVNDRDLPEFEDDEEEQLPNTVTKYVEAVSNSTFHIKISCLQKPAWYGGTGLCFGVELDGEQVAHPLFRGDQTTSLVKGSSKCINGKWTLQRFKFSDIIIGMFTIVLEPIRLRIRRGTSFRSDLDRLTPSRQ